MFCWLYYQTVKQQMSWSFKGPMCFPQTFIVLNFEFRTITDFQCACMWELLPDPVKGTDTFPAWDACLSHATLTTLGMLHQQFTGNNLHTWLERYWLWGVAGLLLLHHNLTKGSWIQTILPFNLISLHYHYNSCITYLVRKVSFKLLLPSI